MAEYTGRPVNGLDGRGELRKPSPADPLVFPGFEALRLASGFVEDTTPRIGDTKGDGFFPGYCSIYACTRDGYVITPPAAFPKGTVPELENQYRNPPGSTDVPSGAGGTPRSAPSGGAPSWWPFGGGSSSSGTAGDTLSDETWPLLVLAGLAGLAVWLRLRRKG